MHQEDKAEIDRIVDLLRTLIRLTGLSNREIERRLNLSPSYLSRLFGGYLEVKMEHVLGIGRALGLRPQEVFAFLYPPERAEEPSEAARSLRAILHSLQPPPRQPEAAKTAAPPTYSAEEVERRIQQALEQVFRDLNRSAG
ncbi:MAG: helix-turn-helix domain-containing protein [Thermoanaerobaculia bacterium]